MGAASGGGAAEAKLVDPAKCSLSMKDIIRLNTGKQDEKSGLALGMMMNCAVFWAGTALTTTAHRQWSSVLCTTLPSCASLSEPQRILWHASTAVATPRAGSGQWAGGGAKSGILGDIGPSAHSGCPLDA